ncbi:MAG TPA: RnfABCDGE type electron transport complex subunit B, partial [Rhodocyclaceae bacterium]|nr:RnfABCDGE type electron transport complex subunit B [Rhodocyclaceae bacterium]
MITAVAVMALGAVILGFALGYASIKFKVQGDPLVDKIDGILPQTQCGQCGYPGCRPYAEAIANGIRRVIARTSEEYELEFPGYNGPSAPWYRVRATRFSG